MTIYRGPGGGGNADSDAEINALAALSNQALIYSEAAALEAAAAALSADEAATSASAAATSASSATTSASSASTSATSASNSASSASTSATDATTSASAASTSASSASSSASSAFTSSTNAASSATAAATSASSASTSATNAASSATTATTQAGIAATQASNAATSATTASTQASNASTSASNAATSATNASNSASAASTSATNAANSATEAAASAASIDDASLVHKTGNETIAGVKTFSSTIVGSVNGNAATATNVAYSGLTGTVPTWNQNTTGSAATLATGRTIAITGDLAYTSPSFNGSANVTAAGTLATVNANVGSFTAANITVNAKGLITAAANGTASSVLQVVSAVKTDTFSTTSGSFTEVTGLNVSITPSSASSKVLVTCSVAVGYNNDGTVSRRGGMSLFRGSTNLLVPTSPGSRSPTSAWATELSSNEAYDIYTFQFLDSPNTTSSTNYNIKVLNGGAGASTVFVNRSEADNDQGITGRAVSTITAMEVAA